MIRVMYVSLQIVGSIHASHSKTLIDFNKIAPPVATDILWDDDTVWSPVTDHYVNKVNFFSVNSKCQDCFYVADKGIIYSND